MARSAFVLGSGLWSLVLSTAALAQPGGPPVMWPDPPTMQRPAAPPAQNAPAQPRANRPAATAQQPVLQEEPAANAAAPAARAARPAASPLNIRCDGPFARDSNHAKLVQAFGAKNVTVQEGGVTVLFANDPKRRLEITWHDADARRRPAMIVVEGPSSWRARGFRIGEGLPAVEKANGKPFRIAGFEGEQGGAARDWQGGALDKLSGGCQLGMRFALGAATPPDARSKLESASDLTSDAPEVRAAQPTIAELIVGYPQ